MHLALPCELWACKLQQLWHLVRTYSYRVVRCSTLAADFSGKSSLAAIYLSLFHSHDR